MKGLFLWNKSQNKMVGEHPDASGDAPPRRINDFKERLLVMKGLFFAPKSQNKKVGEQSRYFGRCSATADKRF